MDLLRIGDKVISKRKTITAIEQIFKLRAEGTSQVETAKKVGVDRTFISRLESLGEVRKGNRIAVIGFPVQNKEEIEQVLYEEGVEFFLVLTEAQRWEFLQKNGLELFNYIMTMISQLKEYDQVIVLGSNYRIELMSMVVGKEIIGMEIGKSPIEADQHVNAAELRSLVITLKEGSQV